MVCPWAGSSLGVCASAVLLGLRAAARDEGIGTPLGIGHNLADARYPGVGRGKTSRRGSDFGCAEDSRVIGRMKFEG